MYFAHTPAPCGYTEPAVVYDTLTVERLERSDCTMLHMAVMLHSMAIRGELA